MKSEHDEVDRILEEWRRERPDLDASPMAIFGRLLRIRHLAEVRLATTLERFGLTLPSFDVLANLRRSGPPYKKTPSELAESSMLTSGGVTFRLDRLEAENLIQRIPSTEDRRVMYAELTPTGLELIDKVIADHLETEHEMLAALSSDDQINLAALLQALERSVRDQSDGSTR